MSIRIDYQPSEWRCLWLYPSRPNDLFSQIQVWSWLRVHNEDDYLDDDWEIRRASEDDEE